MPALTREEITVLVEAIAGGLSSQAGLPVESRCSDDRELMPGTGKGSPGNACRRIEEVFDASRSELRRLASLIDHTLLRPEATQCEVLARCSEALELGFAVVCVNPSWVPLVARELRRSQVKVGTVVGFPLGANLASSKRAEAEAVLRAGAQEIDMVMKVGAMRAADLDRVERGIRGVVEVCQARG